MEEAERRVSGSGLGGLGGLGGRGGAGDNSSSSGGSSSSKKLTGPSKMVIPPRETKNVRIAAEFKKRCTIKGDEKNQTKIKSHSVHGMMDNERGASRPFREMGVLTYEEKKFLLAVERGDVASVRRMLDSIKDGSLNINCCDPLGRSALLMAIDNENLEMVDLLLDNKVETKDALLHAINEEYVEAVEVLLEHEESIHKDGELHSWEAIPPDTATFTPDITPLVLAAHRDNYEIIKILLDRGATLPIPHDVRCGCEECMTSRQEDSLRHSRSRINAYRALASPSLIALSSKDPILTAFELSWELRRLSFAEHEFKSEYLELRTQCQKFATALLDHTRSSYELEILLNHDPTGPVYQHGERMHLNRLKLAIKYRQKKFVAHPNVQQLLASIWYEGLPGFRQMNVMLQFLEVCRIGLLFPFLSLAYVVLPFTSFSQKLRKPFIKFICNSSSYFTFLFLLILASQRIEVVIAEWFQNEQLKQWLSHDVTTKRGSTPTLVEWCILAWVGGLIWSEIKQLWDVGLKEYVNDMWNVIDFVTNSLYVATIALRLVAYYKVQEEIRVGSPSAQLPREHWDTWDPMLISEGLFAAANIFSNLKLVYIFSVNPYLGPLQVSLSRMVVDILKFTSLFFLVLFAFSCGANQLLWYYADLEKQRCYNDQLGIKKAPLLTGNITYGPQAGVIQHDINHCLAWRRFANLWETSQTLFWAIFGLIDLDNFELTGIKEFTRFSGLLMFGSFSVINIIVLLNLLIAMMNHSYQMISVSSEKADIEWKFARSKLWISYFEEGGTVPPPFNIIPTPKSLFYLIKWALRKACGKTSQIKKEHLKTKRVKQASERDTKYQTIMRNLVRRYVTQEQRKAENEGVTEDDVNEIKNDISAFRFELIEILRQYGMDVSTAAGQLGAAGKKNRQKERRLMKGFNLSTGGASATGNVNLNIGATGTGNGGSTSSIAVTGANGGGGGGSITGSAAGNNGGGRRTPLLLQTTAVEVNADRRASPISKLARFARIAGSARDGIFGSGTGSLGPPDYVVDHHTSLLQRLSNQSSEEAAPPYPGLGEEGSGYFGLERDGSTGRRDKYLKTRGPIQCLNPLQLQPPSSVAKGQNVSGACGSDSQQQLSSSDRTKDDDFGRSFAGIGLGGSLQRTFNVDLEEEDGGGGGDQGQAASSSRQETLPLLFPSSSSDLPNSLLATPSCSSPEERSSAATAAKARPGGSATTAAAATAASTASAPAVVVPGLKQNRNSNSGWL